MPSIEKVRMVNIGTEATMSCIRLARAFTGRDRIIKFDGCYHGHVDGLLVKAGSGALTHGRPTVRACRKHLPISPSHFHSTMPTLFGRHLPRTGARSQQ